MVDYDTARRCPRCSEPGQETAKKRGRKPGTNDITLTCMNSRCRWFETPWVVTINADGSITERQHEKEFPKLHMPSGKAIVESVLEELERPTGPGRQP